MLKHCVPAAFAGLTVCALPAGAAAQTLPNQLIGGQAQRSLGASCYADRGFATFQRNFASAPAAGTKAVVSLPEVIVKTATLNVAYDVSGQAVLNFSTATSGNIRFKQLPNVNDTIKSPAFSNYAESYNATAKQLTVSFTIGFPNCSLPIVLILDAVT
jgi:hypothetical protein